ncbi:MAG: GNAT family N-acetyltransferase [Gemmatimonadaceae bacterium]|jgi:predicted acetyltransferase|nr:GNAT family N-acetyltransferase [Gemmatimonadaceae bacterium]
MHLVRPTAAHLPSYVRALEGGWSPNARQATAAIEELARIARDLDGFLAALEDREGRGAAVVLPDGTTVPRLPGFTRWLWDGEFCGRISVRWQPGTPALPPTCLGHIGYAVVPWKQRRGYATRALGLVLAEVPRVDWLPYVEVTTDVTNHASRRVIEANGGVLVARFVTPASHGSVESLRYRITL